MKTKLHEALVALTKEQLGFDPVQLENEDTKYQSERVRAQIVHLLFLLLSLFVLLIGCVGCFKNGFNFASCIAIVVGISNSCYMTFLLCKRDESLNQTKRDLLSQWQKVEGLMNDVSGLFDDCVNVEDLRVQIDSMMRFIVLELKKTPRVDLILTTSNPRLEQKRFNLDTLIRIVINLKLFGSDKLEYQHSVHTDVQQRQKDDEETLICLITKRILDNPVAPLT